MENGIKLLNAKSDIPFEKWEEWPSAAGENIYMVGKGDPLIANRCPHMLS